MRPAILALACACAWPLSGEEVVNSIGMRLVRVEPGRFRMGNDQPVGADAGGPPGSPNGDWDERPVHQVTITTTFFLSATEVTADEYRQFEPKYQGGAAFAPWAAGVSWDDAAAFCRWLSRKDGRTYRLPTEAEWERAARGGISSHIAQWVYDWHGMYPAGDQVDPVGPESGYARVIRGGALFVPPAPYYARPANRASLPPDYRPAAGIGFRVVLGEMPATPPLPYEAPFVQQAVKQKRVATPVLEGAYFRARWLLTIPPENVSRAKVEAVGLDPGIHYHNHSPGLAVLANGDLLATYFSSPQGSREDATDATMIAARLRCGADEWDLSDMLFDLADANDQSALLWTEGEAVNFMWGGREPAGIIFKWVSSKDNGATWSPIRMVSATPPFGAYAEQPITSAFRGSDGTLYVATDDEGGTSMLWANADNGQTWRDAGGRSGGRHTAYVLLKNGCILGMGGKNTDIEGYMPQSVSCDQGKTWQVSRTQFPALANLQRPTLIRLASGRLFFASDHQSSLDRQPAGYTKRGAFAALSGDEGKTWTVRDLTAATPSERVGRLHDNAASLGYTVARQAPDGIIHLITSNNEQAMHFEMNEAWVLGAAEEPPHAETQRVAMEETQADGGRARWGGLIGADGRFHLDGPEMWFYPNGKPRYVVNWRRGRKFGAETYWSAGGRKLWSWTHESAGSVWTRFGPDGAVLSQSIWANGRGRPVSPPSASAPSQ